MLAASLEDTMTFTGVWDVVSSPDFDDDYLRMEVDPYIDLEQEGNRVSGEYQVGLQQGTIDGRLQDDTHVFFSFEGNDEMDEVNGAGTITLNGDRLEFTLMYHQGDDYTFACVRRR
jgi:hypothetical protein